MSLTCYVLITPTRVGGDELKFNMMKIVGNQKLALAILALTACLASIGRAEDPFPVWQTLADQTFEIVTALKPETSSSYILIVRDSQRRNFLCYLQSSRSFDDVRELTNCQPIVTQENADLQSKRNLNFISTYLAENVPRDICGVDANVLWKLAYERFGGDSFQEEFGRWDQHLTNRLIRVELEAIDGLIVIEAQMREGRIWSHRQVIWSEFEDELDTITFIDEGQRVLFEDACS